MSENRKIHLSVRMQLNFNEGIPALLFKALGCSKLFVREMVGGMPKIITHEVNMAFLPTPPIQKTWWNKPCGGGPEAGPKETRAYAEWFIMENIAKEILIVYSKVFLRDRMILDGC